MRLALAVALALTSCGSKTSSGEAGSLASVAIAPEPSPAVVASPPPSAAPSAPSAPSLKGFAALQARFPDEPPWPSGKGIVCGAAVCSPKEFCCHEETGPTCEPKGQEVACSKQHAPVVGCDESSDCAGAERCCSGGTEESTLTTCASEKRCATYWDRPGGFMIPAKEICAAGGACKGKDLVCTPATRATSVSGGQCVSAKARVACESKADCPDDKPWCFWDAEAKKGECIPRGPWLREPGVLECDDHTDCPGGLCCGGNDLTFCSPAECDPGLAYAAIICRTAKDCGLNADNDPSCIEDDKLPPGIGMCGWSRRETPEAKSLHRSGPKKP